MDMKKKKNGIYYYYNYEGHKPRTQNYGNRAVNVLHKS